MRLHNPGRVHVRSIFSCGRGIISVGEKNYIFMASMLEIIGMWDFGNTLVTLLVRVFGVKSLVNREL